MKSILAVSAALLIAGSAWAAQVEYNANYPRSWPYERDQAFSWNADRDNLNYSESASTAVHRNFLAERDTSLAGQPGVGDEMGRTDERKNISGRADRDDVLSWNSQNYSERGSTAFHRDFDNE